MTSAGFRAPTGPLVFRSFLALSLVVGRGDTPVTRGSWILDGEEDSIDRSFTASWEWSVDACRPHRPALAGRSAGRVPPVLHRTHIPNLPRIGCWSDRADPPPNGVWNAHRRRAGAGVASQPRTPIVHQRPLVERRARIGPGRSDRGPNAPCEFCAHDRGRRHLVQAVREESLRGGVASRRGGEGPETHRLRQLLGGGRHRGAAVVSVPPGVPTGAGPAVATPAHREDRAR